MNHTMGVPSRYHISDFSELVPSTYHGTAPVFVHPDFTCANSSCRARVLASVMPFASASFNYDNTTYSMIQCPLDLYSVYGPTIPYSAIGHHCVFRDSRRLQNPVSVKIALRRKKETCQALYSLGIVSGLTSQAYMICPQHRPNTRRSPWGTCTPNLGA